MKKKSLSLLLIWILCASSPVHSQLSGRRGDPYSPPANGVVPDENAAVEIAEVILRRIYGSRKIDGEEPFVAVLAGDVWTVTGSLPKGTLGGTASVQILRSTGAILFIGHGM